MTAPWVSQAACSGTDPEMFFSGEPNDHKAAKRICRGCPVIAECLDYAVRREAHSPFLGELYWSGFGIWGGKSPKERIPLIQTFRRTTRRV